jgi:virginiamycin B lyase
MVAARSRRGAGAIGPVLATLALLLAVLPATADAARLYWANLSSTTIGRADLAGTGAVQNFITGASAPSGVATDGSFIYWGNSSGGTIGRANLDGTGANPSFITGASTPGGIAVDAQHIYWANFGGSTIGRANLDGTNVKQDFITGANNPRGVAVDPQHIYWSNVTGGARLSRANLDGTGVESSFINVGATEPAEIAVNAQHIYWANGETGNIGRANRDGSEPNATFISIPAPRNLLGLAIDAQHIYWTNFNLGTIGRANLDGSGVNGSFITGASGPFGLEINSLPHPSATTIACTPVLLALQQIATCTATVADADTMPFPVQPGLIAPTGTVTLSSGAGTFTPAASCLLTPVGLGRSACQVAFVATAAGQATINAAYSGDSTHAAGTGATTLRVKPSNSFTLAKRKLNRRKGTATLTLTVPGPGTLLLKGKKVKKFTKTPKAAGKVKLKVRPKKSIAKTLQEKGSAKVAAAITYSPTGGDPLTKSVRLTLRLNPGH